MTLSAGPKASARAYLHDGGWPPVCCLCCDVSYNAIRLPPEHFGLGHNFSCVPKHSPAGTESSPVKGCPLVLNASGRSCDGLETGQVQLSALCWLLLSTLHAEAGCQHHAGRAAGDHKTVLVLVSPSYWERRGWLLVLVAQGLHSAWFAVSMGGEGSEMLAAVSARHSWAACPGRIGPAGEDNQPAFVPAGACQ